MDAHARGRCGRRRVGLWSTSDPRPWRFGPRGQSCCPDAHSDPHAARARSQLPMSGRRVYAPWICRHDFRPAIWKRDDPVVAQPAARANDRRTGDPPRSRCKLLWRTVAVVRVNPRRCSAGGLGALRQDGSSGGIGSDRAGGRGGSPYVRRWQPPAQRQRRCVTCWGQYRWGFGHWRQYRRRRHWARRRSGLHPGWAPHPLLSLPQIIYVYISIYLLIYMFFCLSMDIYICLCIHIYMYVYIHTYICMYVCMYLFIYICIYVYMYIYINLYHYL